MASIMNYLDKQKMLYSGIETPFYDPMNDMYDQVASPIIKQRLADAKKGIRPKNKGGRPKKNAYVKNESVDKLKLEKIDE